MGLMGTVWSSKCRVKELLRRGFTVLELLFVLTILGVVAAVGASRFDRWSSGLKVEMAAEEIAGALRLARVYAILHQANVAVKFTVAASGEVYYALYRDGDGDGVRSNDIAAGVDREEQPPVPLQHLDRSVGFGFPPGRPPKDPNGSGRRLDRLDDPIRFNNTDLASFSSRGTATPGTVYLTDHRRHLAAARVNNRVGKVTVLLYDPAAEVWR